MILYILFDRIFVFSVRGTFKVLLFRPCKAAWTGLDAVVASRGFSSSPSLPATTAPQEENESARGHLAHTFERDIKEHLKVPRTEKSKISIKQNIQNH